MERRLRNFLQNGNRVVERRGAFYYEVREGRDEVKGHLVALKDGEHG